MSRPRRRALAADQPRGLAHLYAARRRRPVPDLFVTDQAEARRGGGFRWFFSTCIAAMVAAIAIGAVVFGSIDLSMSPGRMVATLRQSTLPPAPDMVRKAAVQDGLAWNIPKSARLRATMDAASTRYIVQEAIRERRANRAYLQNKRFARIMIRLAAVQPDESVSVPPFNPLKLFTTPPKEGTGPGPAGTTGPEGGDVTLRIVELLGSILPAEDGQEIDTREAADLVLRALANEEQAAPIRPTFAPEGFDAIAAGSRNASGSLVPNTTLFAKTSVEADDPSEELGGEVMRVRLARGKTLTSLLVQMGAETWQAREMVDSAQRIAPEASITPGHQIDLTLVPSLSRSGAKEPVRYVVYSPKGAHRVTVERNEAGEFVASADPAPQRSGGASAPTRQSGITAPSRYVSLYHGALAQGIPPETIETILRLHAYEADFRRRSRGSDAVELFFDLKESEIGSEPPLGELLLTSVTIGGTSHKFYRFKASDGSVDYYDPNGNNSRRFLLRKPVRAEDVRLTSGFGLRFHPLLNQRKLHSGIDWAGRSGSPIIAAGHGTIEEAGYKGQYGNYVRIRHANGYQTAYGHMRKLADGIAPGIKVRQGQVIGYLGSTGLSSGPHLHFEVLVNGRFVDPLSIQVPREKHLTGRQLVAFQRERVRIDSLMRKPPVTVSTIESPK